MNKKNILEMWEADEICVWEQNEEGDYRTSCDNCFRIYVLDNGTPEENKMKFCCYCGRLLETVETEEGGRKP